MTDFEEFKQLSDRLIQAMTPEQVLECLRAVALHLADLPVTLR